jgi:hypothetical protein
MKYSNRFALRGAVAASVVLVAACGSTGVATSAGTSQHAASSSAATQQSSAAATPGPSLASACTLTLRERHRQRSVRPPMWEQRVVTADKLPRAGCELNNRGEMR